jgi:hypothetical protein
MKKNETIKPSAYKSGNNDDFLPKVNDGIHIRARNSHGQNGKCAFYYLAIHKVLQNFDDTMASSAGNIIIGTGVTNAIEFGNSGTWGDWQSWEIYFERHFLTPPVVLVTAFNGKQTVPVH